MRTSISVDGIRMYSVKLDKLADDFEEFFRPRLDHYEELLETRTSLSERLESAGFLKRLLLNARMLWNNPWHKLARKRHRRFWQAYADITQEGKFNKARKLASRELGHLTLVGPEPLTRAANKFLDEIEGYS